MFCPQCGAEASPDLRFCRSCGLSLSRVEAALDDRLDGALAELQHGARALKIGLVSMGLFGLVAIVAAASSGPFDVTVGPLLVRVSDWGVSLILALLLGMPAVGLGYRRIRRAARQIQAANKPEDGAGVRTARLDGGAEPVRLGDGEPPVAWDVAARSEDRTLRLEQARDKDQ